ncbi:MAG: hypothetical protein PHC41_11420 [Lachnospiraceae bacterium]|nr:hypothetical protein [Lachnospiraceae bacterium]MDD3616817.1 hypothetical protein [Lachnospiraceae bacterium]
MNIDDVEESMESLKRKKNYMIWGIVLWFISIIAGNMFGVAIVLIGMIISVVLFIISIATKVE